MSEVKTIVCDICGRELPDFPNMKISIHKNETCESLDVCTICEEAFKQFRDHQKMREIKYKNWKNKPNDGTLLSNVLAELKKEIENRSYGIANASVIQGEMYERRAVLEIIDNIGKADFPQAKDIEPTVESFKCTMDNVDKLMSEEKGTKYYKTDDVIKVLLDNGYGDEENGADPEYMTALHDVYRGLENISVYTIPDREKETIYIDKPRGYQCQSISDI